MTGELQREKNALAERLAACKDTQRRRLLAGFDGFVDEIVHVVDQRIDVHSFQRIKTIEEYGQRIIQSAGKSTNFENVVIRQKPGGNGTIYAIALDTLGMQVRYIGATGVDRPHAVYEAFSKTAELIGLCAPAETQALEFQDGKLICSKLTAFDGFGWDCLVQKVGLKALTQYMDEADLISFNNWTMLLGMNECWRHLLDEVVPVMQTPPQQKQMFFDLADPQKRSQQDLKTALELIREFQKAGFSVTLGLNLKEAQ